MNPLLQRLAGALANYRCASIDLEHLHSVISSVSSSLESDVSKELRTAIREADNALELVRFGGLATITEALAVLAPLERALALDSHGLV